MESRGREFPSVTKLTGNECAERSHFLRGREESSENNVAVIRTTQARKHREKSMYRVMSNEDTLNRSQWTVTVFYIVIQVFLKTVRTRGDGWRRLRRTNK